MPGPQAVPGLLGSVQPRPNSQLLHYARHVDTRQPARLDAVKRRMRISGDDVPFALPARVWAVRGTVPISF
jgi:hypothetical protein